MSAYANREMKNYSLNGNVLRRVLSRLDPGSWLDYWHNATIDILNYAKEGDLLLLSLRYVKQ